jgi:hypothetical protein
MCLRNVLAHGCPYGAVTGLVQRPDRGLGEVLSNGSCRERGERLPLRRSEETGDFEAIDEVVTRCHEHGKLAGRKLHYERDSRERWYEAAGTENRRERAVLTPGAPAMLDRCARLWSVRRTGHGHGHGHRRFAYGSTITHAARRCPHALGEGCREGEERGERDQSVGAQLHTGKVACPSRVSSRETDYMVCGGGTTGVPRAPGRDRPPCTEARFDEA